MAAENMISVKGYLVSEYIVDTLKENGYEDTEISKFVSERYGDGMPERVYCKYINDVLLSEKMHDQLKDRFTKEIKASETKKYYENSRDKYDVVDAYMYTFGEMLVLQDGESENEFAVRQKQVNEAAKKDAVNMLNSVSDEKSFADYAWKTDIRQ